MMSIAHMGRTTLPAIDERFMPNTLISGYWAAGTVRNTFFKKELAWFTDFAHGLGGIGMGFRQEHGPVRLVRGGEHGGQRFDVSPDGQEVSDRATRLTWRRCVEGLSFDGEHCSGQRFDLTWTKALAHARHHALHTGVAWRLPNLKELASLLDHRGLPHIDIAAFPDADADVLWTSSSTQADTTPRCVGFRDGLTFFCSQGSNTFGSRLVRDSD